MIEIRHRHGYFSIVELRSNQSLTSIVQLLNYVHQGMMGGSVREYRYCGSEHRPQRVSDHSAPLSPENAKTVIQKAWATGRIHIGSHIKKRMLERGIDTIDVGNVIRTGAVCGKQFCEVHKNWKYRMAGISDERELEVIVALDATEDFSDSPLAVLLTTFEKNVLNPGPEKQGG